MAKTTAKINKQKQIEKKKRKTRKIKLILIIIIILIIGISAYLLTSPIFAIQQISVNGNSQVSSEKIRNLAEIKKGDNIFSKLGIVMKVKIKQNGGIEDVQINKIYPNKVEIQVKERIKQFQIQTEAGGYVYIDEQGYIFGQGTEKIEIPTIIGMDITENDVSTLKRLTEKDLNKMENILQIREQCKDLEIADKITQIEVKNQYIITLESEGLTINLGDCTDLKNRMFYVGGILKQEAGNRGTIYVNGNLNENFSAYFSAQ